MLYSELYFFVKDPTKCVANDVTPVPKGNSFYVRSDVNHSAGESCESRLGHDFAVAPIRVITDMENIIPIVDEYEIQTFTGPIVGGNTAFINSVAVAPTSRTVATNAVPGVGQDLVGGTVAITLNWDDKGVPNTYDVVDSATGGVLLSFGRTSTTDNGGSTSGSATINLAPGTNFIIRINNNGDAGIDDASIEGTYSYTVDPNVPE